jgi:ATP-dependent DNA ligase I
MTLEQLARTSRAVAGTRARLTKTQLLASFLRLLDRAEVPVAVAYLSGELPQGAIGVGWAALRELPPPATAPTLELLDVHEALSRIGHATGPGSQAIRRAELRALYARATDCEQSFLTALVTGELRQGALEGVMVEAIARGTGVASRELRRALMVSGDLGTVAAAAASHGTSGLGRFSLTVLRPVHPMLAQSGDSLDEALERTGRAAVEWKVDGARIQLHRSGDEVRAFTRNLADITERVPELVAAVRQLPVTSVILDGEAIALRQDRRPHPFQVTMGRFGTKSANSKLGRDVWLSVFVFDCLHLDGTDLIDRPADQRLAAVTEVVPAGLMMPRIVTDELAAAERFLDDALQQGHEGVMVKALDAPYEAGRRGGGWLKVKRAKTLDLVVLAAEWGHGRRQGKLSNLHLGARDPGTGGFVMLGKTFKGMTDEMLTWQTDYLLGLETARSGITVFVRPGLVVEVAFDGLQRSPRYPAGMALRFARVKGYRPDKTSAEADTIETVRAIHEGT